MLTRDELEVDETYQFEALILFRNELKDDSKQVDEGNGRREEEEGRMCREEGCACVLGP